MPQPNQSLGRGTTILKLGLKRFSCLKSWLLLSQEAYLDTEAKSPLLPYSTPCARPVCHELHDRLGILGTLPPNTDSGSRAPGTLPRQKTWD